MLHVTSARSDNITRLGRSAADCQVMLTVLTRFRTPRGVHDRSQMFPVRLNATFRVQSIPKSVVIPHRRPEEVRPRAVHITLVGSRSGTNSNTAGSQWCRSRQLQCGNASHRRRYREIGVCSGPGRLESRVIDRGKQGRDMPRGSRSGSARRVRYRSLECLDIREHGTGSL